MSELIQKHDNRATIHWKLLTSASALALTAYVATATIARAEDADRAALWIELGGQLSRLQDGQEIYAPPFVDLTQAPFTPPQKAERPPLYGLDENAALTFQPEGSSWHFSASIRYGRASSGKHVHHQSYPSDATKYVRVHRVRNSNVRNFTNYYLEAAQAARFTDAAVKQSENHAILDFQAGKDLGLGLFGHDASSSLSVGVRIAQFGSKSRSDLKEDPDWQFKSVVTHYSTYRSNLHNQQITHKNLYQPYHTFEGNFQANRKFTGLGPSLSWKESVPFAGNAQDGGLSVDWGVNAALIFGRQKVKANHQTKAHYGAGHFGSYLTPVYTHGPYHRTRSRSVTVPNIGGFAGLSFNYPDAKVSLGYKADFFFGAIDGGIDTAKKENRGFYGPYASISIGLGD